MKNTDATCSLRNFGWINLQVHYTDSVYIYSAQIEMSIKFLNIENYLLFQPIVLEFCDVTHWGKIKIKKLPPPGEATYNTLHRCVSYLDNFQNLYTPRLLHI